MKHGVEQLLLYSKHGSRGESEERALSVGGRLGGHVVTGHIDGTGKISSIKKKMIMLYGIKSTPQKEILDLIVEKGSITIDSISLTIAKVSKVNFSVSVIPHTLNKPFLE